jgi:hypothetical protein
MFCFNCGAKLTESSDNSKAEGASSPTDQTPPVPPEGTINEDGVCEVQAEDYFNYLKAQQEYDNRNANATQNNIVTPNQENSNIEHEAAEDEIPNEDDAPALIIDTDITQNRTTPEESYESTASLNENDDDDYDPNLENMHPLTFLRKQRNGELDEDTSEKEKPNKKTKENNTKLRFREVANNDGYYNDRVPSDYGYNKENKTSVLPTVLAIIGVILFAIVVIKMKSLL